MMYLSPFSPMTVKTPILYLEAIAVITESVLLAKALLFFLQSTKFRSWHLFNNLVDHNYCFIFALLIYVYCLCFITRQN